MLIKMKRDKRGKEGTSISSNIVLRMIINFTKRLFMMGQAISV